MAVRLSVCHLKSVFLLLPLSVSTSVCLFAWLLESVLFISSLSMSACLSSVRLCLFFSFLCLRFLGSLSDLISVCLSVCLSLCLGTCLSACLTLISFSYIFLFMSVYPSACVYMSKSVFSVCLSLFSLHTSFTFPSSHLLINPTTFALFSVPLYASTPCHHSLHPPPLILNTHPH